MASERVKAARRFVVRWRHNDIDWRRVYYTLAHANQYARALRGNGLAGVVVEVKGAASAATARAQ